jgi:RAB6A-GEF complex partner protein 2
MASDIQVSIRFREQCVFAGEEVACTITFKNVADTQMNTPTTLESGHSGRRNSISQLAAMSMRGGRGAQNHRVITTFGRGDMNSHKTTMSLSTPLSTTSEVFSPIGPPPQGPAHKQKRSISIISGPKNALGRSPTDNTLSSSIRSNLGHSRSSTVNTFLGARTGSGGGVQGNGLQVPSRSRSRSPLTSSTSPDGSAAQSRESTPDFKFPAGDGVSTAGADVVKDGRTSQPGLPVTKNKARDVSGSSVADSNRSSTEFHSLSNHSQETLISEQPSIMSDVPQFPSARIRQRYHMGPVATKTPTTAKLLMGYAQVNASFTLDSSLVDPSPFEEVKRKGFLGGQAGGGVVGVKKPRPATGFFGGLGLNNIGESIGSLMSGTDLSSVKEMKAVASSRAIPLLSTPQSLLFVDLQLAPGEGRSYSFAYVLPRGLPSSHRGKAIRIGYNLVVGVQGAPSARDVQTMRHIKVPLRVFSGVNSEGEIFGHDLMQPHVILRDSAKAAAVESETDFPTTTTTSSTGRVDAETNDFLRYADGLLDKTKRRQSSSGTLATLSQDRPDADTQTAKGAISRAVLFSNQVTGSENSSPNRFDIARGGLRVAVITLDRPMHRLGETITASIDFSNGELPCLNVLATLETTEQVNPALAVRSTASISRVTRKIYAAHSENTLFAQRVVFCPSIPVTATPTLLTSGVNLDWSLRFEFGTAKLPSTLDGEASDPSQIPELLEEINVDERGTVLAAVEIIDCESFEVIIPITVFGDVVTDKEKDEEVISLPI